MNYLLKPILALSCMVLLSMLATASYAEEKMVIELKSSDFELTATDISSLAVGESKTIETDSGKVIDILRTTDGAEIYVDGELLDINTHPKGHKVKKHVEIVCDDEQDCEREVVVIAGGDVEVTDFIGEGGNHVIIHKEVILNCSDDEGGASCSDKNIWVSEDGDIDMDVVHEAHDVEGAHKVIIIEKDVVIED